MSSFLLWSDTGDGAFIGARLKREGHRVRMFINDEKSKHVFDGIVEKVKRPNPQKGDVVLFDMVRFGKHADALRKKGIPTVGASAFADLIELDRTEGSKLMNAFGIKTPETHTFKNVAEGMDFLRGQDGYWFFKPSGNQDAGQTFGEEAKSLIPYLKWSGETYNIKEFQLQKKMEGTEISLEGWFDGKRFVYPFNSTVEDKKFMTGDKGPRTGCMANVVWAYENPRPTLAMKTVQRIQPALESVGFVGPIDLNMILDSEGVPHGLEWSPRFGYDALQAFSMLMPGDLGDDLAKFARGELECFNVRDDVYALTVNVSVPPYPQHQIAEEMHGLPMDPLLFGYPGSVHLRDIMRVGARPCIAGADCTVATIGEIGPSVPRLRQQVLELVGKFKIPNAQYRMDPVTRFESVIADLKKFGYDLPQMEVRNDLLRRNGDRDHIEARESS